MSEEIQSFQELSYLEGGGGVSGGGGGGGGKSKEIMDNLVTIRVPGVGTFMVKGTLIKPLDPNDSFEVKLKKNGSGYTAQIAPGTINGILPSNIFSTFSVSSTTTYFIARATTNGKQVVSAVIIVSSSPPQNQTPVPQALPASFDKLFAISMEGNVFRTIPSGSITVAPQPLFTADRDSWTPGKPMTETWYSWAV